MRRAAAQTALFAFLALPAVLLVASEARADIVVGAGVGVAVPISAQGYNAGVAVDGRLGYEFSFTPISLAIEAAGGYTTMPAEALAPGTAGAIALSNAKIARIMGGLKLGVGKLVVPFIAAHAGYGWLTQDAGGVDVSDKGFAMDAKLGFDIRPINLISLGVNGGYNLLTGRQAAQVGATTIGAAGSLNYLSFGVQAALAF
jgi:hypothetical protein